MANTPKKMKDPTEAALSAIQDALHIRDDDPPKDQTAPAPTDGLPADPVPSETPWPGLRETRASRRQPEVYEDDEDAARCEDAATMRRPAANDDQELIGNILRTIQRRPGKTSYILASVFAGVWVVGGFALGWLYLPDLQAALGPSGLTAPVLAVLGAIYLAPVVFFYVLAYMAVRSQEMRLIAQSMAEVAMRLAEPETVARESIVTVGQAIRREVAAMGDGIERALARAAELETLVANEVSALEHAYNDNEVRIRALLQDLGSQRDTLVGQAEAVRDAINGVHLDLSNDISQISQLVAEQVNDAARRITMTFAEKGEHITRALGHAGDNMIEQLGRARRRPPGAAGNHRLHHRRSDRAGERPAHRHAQFQDRPYRRRVHRDRRQPAAHDVGPPRPRRRWLLAEVGRHPRHDVGPHPAAHRARGRYRQPARRRHFEPRRGGQFDAQDHRRFAGARPFAARR